MGTSWATARLKKCNSRITISSLGILESFLVMKMQFVMKGANLNNYPGHI